MPYLTPASAPVDVTTRALSIPDSEEWVAIVKGALLELCDPYNWQRDEAVGGITVEEAVAAALLIFESINQIAGGDTLLIGSVIMGLMEAAPAGLLPMDGSDYLMSEYPDLMDVYPAALKNTPSSGRFVVPAMAGRAPIGTGGSYALNQSGGSETHTLTVAEMPAHTHEVTIHTSTGSSNKAAGTNGTSLGTQVSGSRGGGDAHNNMQPYRALGFYLVASNG